MMSIRHRARAMKNTKNYNVQSKKVYILIGEIRYTHNNSKKYMMEVDI